MKKSIIILILFCANFSLILAQGTEWHVRPYADNYINPPLSNGRSFETAWCLQYALTGAGGAIQPGDTVWLHGVQKSTYTGTTTATVYKGHFTCNINLPLPEITFASYPGEWAIIDGNIRNNAAGPIATGNINPGNFNPPNLPEGTQGRHTIFAVTSNNVHFHDFEITCLENFSRVHEARTVSNIKDAPLCTVLHDYNFYEYAGIYHTAGVNRFTNLVIRNIPGIAFGSWKLTADTEIYGNILYNNGIIDVTGTSCNPLLSVVVNSGLIARDDSKNTRGHQASIYTQNEGDETQVRNIRNNIFHNCYDSGLIIWSAREELSPDEFVRNYSVTKNIFLNNGSPVRDETANMIVSTLNNPIRDITIDSNIFYVNSEKNYVSGIYVRNANDVTISNNYIVNGTAGMIFDGENNHGINFNNNNYFGKRMQVLTSVGNFNGTNPIGIPWNFHHNHYFNKYLGDENVNMYFAPTAVSGTSITLGTFNSNYSTLTAEANSTVEPFSAGLPSRYFISQNRENTNLFYVTIYNPAQTNSSSVDFTPYNIPINRAFKLRDVQNYFTQMTLTAGNTVPANRILSLPMNNTNFEMPLPIAIPGGFNYGPSQTTDSNVAHTNSDMNTFAIEFDCGLEYDRLVTGATNLETSYVLRNNITFENFTSNNTATDVTARASRQILIRPNSHIKNNTRFLGKIEVTCAEIPYNTALADAAFDMGGGLNRVSNAEETNTITKNEEAFAIYPNPSSGIFTVESLSDQKISKIIIYQMDGPKKIMEKEYKYQSAISIDISNEKIGLYSIHVFLDDKEMQPKTIFKE